METENSKSLTQPRQLISFSKAKELSANFVAQKKGKHVTLSGQEDANAIWFSLEELEKFVEYIKTEGNNQGFTVDGVRIYLGVYSDNETVGKAGFTTMFMSPTGYQSNTGNPGSGGNISQDLTTVSPLNYGSMGNPPKMQYGI
ncbi:hypothetical protein GN157_03930 [Flavobacterium rakeshii]|uniref:Uncharacterized protein n=1 Tax=Flavobacterium rakeshii TaxID=1038845 RepID=A0A6N8H8B4_9FLAO|nr:hypothetical protein [Flavobacterium rakeshii]MEE1898293.1 hypothetical protein [Flavobacterium rakeshii]MUV02849.1 hypothetical protein [Flavobacterium rakeshii]